MLLRPSFRFFMVLTRVNIFSCFCDGVFLGELERLPRGDDAKLIVVDFRDNTIPVSSTTFGADRILNRGGNCTSLDNFHDASSY